VHRAAATAGEDIKADHQEAVLVATHPVAVLAEAILAVATLHQVTIGANAFHPVSQLTSLTVRRLREEPPALLFLSS
jgi:hypothetical protein